MAKTIRFLHCADLHLGSPLKTAGAMSRHLQQALEQASYTAVERLVDTALDFDVHFVLFSGDIYDRDTRSVKANAFFAGQLQRLEKKGIPACIIYGNHDPLGYGEDLFPLPGNVTVFPHEQGQWVPISDSQGFLLARVYGQSYRNASDGRKMHKSFCPPDSSILNIAMLHTGLNPGANTYVPCSMEELRAIPNIHYWALGHIHKTRLCSSTLPVAAFPGIPQGRDPGEPGMGGCLLVEADTERPAQVRFVPLSPVIWLNMEIPVAPDAPDNIQSLEQIILSRGQDILARGPEPYYPEMERIPDAGFPIEGYIVRWEITGRGILHHAIQDNDREELSEALCTRLRQAMGTGNPFLWTESVGFRTASPVPDLEILAARDELLRSLMEKRQSLGQNPELKKKLLSSLGSIWYEQKDQEDIRDDSIPMTPERLESLLDMAQDMVIDRILQEREQLDY